MNSRSFKRQDKKGAPVKISLFILYLFLNYYLFNYFITITYF